MGGGSGSYQAHILALAIALVAHMDVLASLLSASSLIVSAANITVAGCWCSGLCWYCGTAYPDQAERCKKNPKMGQFGLRRHVDSL